MFQNGHSYFEPILAAVFDATATVNVKLIDLLDFYSWAIVPNKVTATLKRTKNGFQDPLSLHVCKKYCRMLQFNKINKT